MGAVFVSGSGSQTDQITRRYIAATQTLQTRNQGDQYTGNQLPQRALPKCAAVAATPGPPCDPLPQAGHFFCVAFATPTATPDRNEKAARRRHARRRSSLITFFFLATAALEGGAGRELRHSGCRDLDGSAGLRVLASARSALGNLEGTETDQGHVLALGHGRGNGSNDGVKCAASSSFADVSTSGST